MSDLNISRKNINEIFSNHKTKFLIPDYQRNYSWTLEHCETLWEDFKAFAFPDGDTESFDEDRDEYFLGTILTFSNEYDQLEVIDGQQRLITLLLLLRAFYESFGESETGPRNELSKCIWRTKGYKPDLSSCKIIYEVVDDEKSEIFKSIIAKGSVAKDDKSRYAENYRFFQKKISDLKLNSADKFSIFPKRILDNCNLLLIVANSQNTALRIFTTLNDRGMPLSDSDIFKAQFYKFYKSKGKVEKENFVTRWKELEQLCNKNFHPRKGTPLDDLFMRYMYYAKTKQAVKANKKISDTFSDMRDFYSESNYEIFQNEETFEDLITLTNFWEDVANRNEKFSSRVLKKLYILNYSPYSVWSYVVSLYFMSNRELDEKRFCNFLDRVTAMILMNAVLDLGKSNIRRPFVMEFKDIFNDEPLEFDIQFKPQRDILKRRLFEMSFGNSKPITRAMLAWWTFRDDAQELPPIDTRLELEHIYAVKRHEFSPLSDKRSLELLGNKALLEKRINIRAADYRFEDKKKYYLGYSKNGRWTPGTIIDELRELAETKENFLEEDILERNEKILSAFVQYLAQNNLLL